MSGSLIKILFNNNVYVILCILANSIAIVRIVVHSPFMFISQIQQNSDTKGYRENHRVRQDTSNVSSPHQQKGCDQRYLYNSPTRIRNTMDRYSD